MATTIQSKSGSTSKWLLFLGFAQLAIALCGIAYAWYPTSHVKTEAKDVGSILADIKRKNPQSEKSQTHNITESVKVTSNRSTPLKLLEIKRVFYVRPSFGHVPQTAESEVKTAKGSGSGQVPVQGQQKLFNVEIRQRTPGPIQQGMKVTLEAVITGGDRSCGKPEYTWMNFGYQNERVTSRQYKQFIEYDTTNGGGIDAFVSVRRGECFGQSKKFPVPVFPRLKRFILRVENVEGRGLEGVDVEIKGQGLIIKKTTRRDGLLPFASIDLPAGRYTLSFSSPQLGYQEHKERIYIGIGESDKHLTITLRPPQSSSANLQPTPAQSPVQEVSPSPPQTVRSPPVEPSPTTDVGQITVTGPEVLAKAWTGGIIIAYTPPSRGRPADFEEGYETLATFKLVDLRGLRDVSGGELPFEPLDTTSQKWALKIEPEETPGNVAEYTVVAEIKLRHRQSGLERSLDQPQTTVQKTNLSIGSRPLSENHVYGGSAIFGMTGLLTLGYGPLKKKYALALSIATHFGASVSTQFDKIVTQTISIEIIRVSREVNAWLVDCELPLVVGKQHTLAVDIGEPRSDRVGGGSFSEPDWGDCDHLDLMILIDGPGVDVTPTSQRVVLPKIGNMETIFFGIRPKTKGPVRLNLSIFLARELTLLEEFLVELSAVEPAEVERLLV